MLGAEVSSEQLIVPPSPTYDRAMQPPPFLRRSSELQSVISQQQPRCERSAELQSIMSRQPLGEHSTEQHSITLGERVLPPCEDQPPRLAAQAAYNFDFEALMREQSATLQRNIIEQQQRERDKAAALQELLAAYARITELASEEHADKETVENIERLVEEATQQLTRQHEERDAASKRLGDLAAEVEALSIVANQIPMPDPTPLQSEVADGG